MKLERRGKYPGVKLHLDGEECEKLLSHESPFHGGSGEILLMIYHQVQKAIEDDPTLLEERSEEEIKATLMKEFVESEKKLAHIKDGLDWKKVKVEVLK